VIFTVAIALGSNLGDRARNLRAAVDALGDFVRVVRISRVRETEPVDAPTGSPPFLNMAVSGYTSLSPEALLDALLSIEKRLGRRRGIRNAPRTIDLGDSHANLFIYRRDYLRPAPFRPVCPGPSFLRR